MRQVKPTVRASKSQSPGHAINGLVTAPQAKKEEAAAAPEETAAADTVEQAGADASNEPPAEAHGSAAAVKTEAKTEDSVAEPAPAVAEAAAKAVLDVKDEPEVGWKGLRGASLLMFCRRGKARLPVCSLGGRTLQAASHFACSAPLTETCSWLARGLSCLPAGGAADSAHRGQEFGP